MEAGIVFAIPMVLFGLMGGLVGRHRTCGELWGGVLGAFLMPLGVLVVLFFPRRKGEVFCPYCKSELRPDASVCCKCGREVYATVRCPYCGKPIKESELVKGVNRCPWCQEDILIDD